jgi:hypothetical protein
MTNEPDVEQAIAWMQELAMLPVEASSLPDPAYLWWKAQLLRRWEAQRTVVAPLEWGERLQVATGLGGAGILLALSGPHFSTIAAGVLILTAALAVEWWRQSFTG